MPQQHCLKLIFLSFIILVNWLIASTARKGIGLSIQHSGLVCNNKVKLRQEFSLPYLSSYKSLSCYKVLQSFVISNNLNQYPGVVSFQIRLLFLKAFDNSKQFFVVDLVVAFSRQHLVREEGNQAEGSILSNLGHYTTGYIVRGVYFNVGLQVQIEMC